MSATNPLPNTLRQLLAKAGLTQREFSEKCGISQGLLQNWMASKSAPSAEDAEAAWRALKLDHTDRDELFDHVIAAHLHGRLLGRYLGNLREFKRRELRISELEAAAQEFEARILALEKASKA